MNIQVDYIIVGLGLAGISFAEILERNNKSFVVFEDNSQNSSIVAGGVYNPVILKRFTPVWNGHKQIELAKPFYKNIEEKLSIQLDYEFPTKKVFNSIGDENNWFIASDKPMLAQYMLPKVLKGKIEGIVGDFGFGELKGTGRVDTTTLVKLYKAYLKKKNLLINESFQHSELSFNGGKAIYKDVITNRVVFCEGFGIKNNPYFNELPLKEAKGETITIHAPELKIDFLLKSSVFVMPLGNDYYKVGATFNWEDKTSTPTKEGKKELEDKLKKVISVPYTVTNQLAGIRPTVKDRRPLVGVHLKYKELAILNGLGTRGVMIGPSMATNLYNHLEKGENLDKEIDIKRFEK